jgi:filamentous hemagglutinin
LEYKANLFTGKSNDFFEGTEYSPKVLRQMNEDSFHGFPESVTAFQQDGYITHIKGGDGIRSQLNIPGYYKGYHGEFQFMKGSDGIINHRFFQPYK